MLFCVVAGFVWTVLSGHTGVGLVTGVLIGTLLGYLIGISPAIRLKKRQNNFDHVH
jgi:ABC-type nitrate/sulfonate/bicarbonate transport system permease component